MDNIENKNVDTKIAEINQTNLFSAHLLNVIAFSLPVLLILGMYLVLPQMESGSESGGGGVSVTVEAPSIPGNPLLACVLIGLIVFIIGIVIYRNPKKEKIKLAYIYLILAIIGLILAFFVFMLFVLSSCGFGIVTFIPGILQIVAGFKFVKALKTYEN
ncbi:MAG: hypothetical protein MR278_07235 [Bacteroidales bacterium]|nr:DUF4064 domain-containing protein [Anaerotignum sp.]MCI5679752.1 hypothetical protein [Bacteroidales bacterium]MDY3927296.1 hypothetical protein [Anaerotignum sp.]